MPVATARTGPADQPVDGYYLSLISLPNFNPLSSYVYNNHGSAYPAFDFAGKYAGDLIYIDTSDRMDWFDPYNGSSGNLSAPLTLLYQTTAAHSGPEDQIDNEFLLDTPNDVALLMGNLTRSPGFLTVETVDLTNGTVSLVTTPARFENNVQADYIGNGTVVVFNATGVGGEPTYLVNMYNHTAWYAGQDIGISANNIYWVPQLGSFLDIQGTMVTQYAVSPTSLSEVGRIWLNNSAVHSITGVNGVVYDPTTRQMALWESTNAGWYYLVVGSTPSGRISAAGSYAFFSNDIIYAQRYCYTSPYVWSVDSPPPALTGPSVLFSPFNNSTRAAPNLVGRQQGSGGNSNFLFENPYATSTIVSLNGSLVGVPSLPPSDFVWASTQPSVTPEKSTVPSSAPPPTSSTPWAASLWWYVGSVGASAAGISLVVVWWGRLERGRQRP